jgi:hypothetical protein
MSHTTALTSHAVERVQATVDSGGSSSSSSSRGQTDTARAAHDDDEEMFEVAYTGSLQPAPQEPEAAVKQEGEPCLAYTYTTLNSL